MRVYFVRHARPENTTSEDVALSVDGVKQAERLGKLFARLQLQPTTMKVVSSPVPRARQTTSLICREMGIADDAATFPAPIDSIPGADLKDRLMKRLQKIVTEEGRTEVIVVGHYPYLSKSFSWLVGTEVVPFPIAYAAAACLTCGTGFEQGSGKLEWLLIADLLP